MPTIRVRQINNNDEWYVTSMGTLQRTEPVVYAYIPITSQFYNKVVNIHEGRHVYQWISMDPWQGLFDANSLFDNVLSSMTSTISEEDLRNQLQIRIDAKNILDAEESEATQWDRECDATNQSNLVFPDYLEVDVL
jgi:hypothetical protein